MLCKGSLNSKMLWCSSNTQDYSRAIFNQPDRLNILPPCYFLIEESKGLPKASYIIFHFPSDFQPTYKRA